MTVYPSRPRHSTAASVFPKQSIPLSAPDGDIELSSSPAAGQSHGAPVTHSPAGLRFPFRYSTPCPGHIFLLSLPSQSLSSRKHMTRPARIFGYLHRTPHPCELSMSRIFPALLLSLALLSPCHASSGGRRIARYAASRRGRPVPGAGHPYPYAEQKGPGRCGPAYRRRPLRRCPHGCALPPAQCHQVSPGLWLCWKRCSTSRPH